jgi:hypothetical protein
MDVTFIKSARLMDDRGEEAAVIDVLKLSPDVLSNIASLFKLLSYS